jgi:hypothetical protein
MYIMKYSIFLGKEKLTDFIIFEAPKINLCALTCAVSACRVASNFNSSVQTYTEKVQRKKRSRKSNIYLFPSKRISLLAFN